MNVDKNNTEEKAEGNAEDKAKEVIEEAKGGMISITDKDNEEAYLYSILPEDFISEHGLMNLAVVGGFSDNKKDSEGNLVVDSFKANPEFINLLHQFLENFGRYSNIVLSQLPHQEEGSWVYLIDQRVPDLSAAIEPKDIIGGFKVEDGKLGEYAGNPSHELITNDGIFMIGARLKQELIEFIKSKYKPN